VPACDNFSTAYDLAFIGDRRSADFRHAEVNLDLVSETEGFEELKSATDPGPAQMHFLAVNGKG
jgi:hypothetical protein